MSDRTGEGPDNPGTPGDEDREAVERVERADEQVESASAEERTAPEGNPAGEAAPAGDEPSEDDSSPDDGSPDDGSPEEVRADAVPGEAVTDEPAPVETADEATDEAGAADEEREAGEARTDGPEEPETAPVEPAIPPAPDREPLLSAAAEEDDEAAAPEGPSPEAPDASAPGADEAAAVGGHDATGEEPATTPDAGPSGWRRLGAALHPRATRSQVLAGVLCAALGFALVVQVQQSASDQLSSARQEDLVRLLDEVTDRAQQLGDEVSGLETTRDELRSGTGKAQSALELAEQRAESEGILSGRLPAQGPGVDVTIQDPSGQLRASQMFNVLEELRNAGAEVVELNDVRLVTSTWFEDKGDAIVVDGTTLTSPYEWTVIGDPETLDRALEIPGGALATVRTAGAEASTTRQDEVKITAVSPPKEPEYAKPERERG
ncbi:DUF881 domain-containing protein [Isoptericola sp. NPDC057559]|uniref:DUF881 domain-containing protein n=1 Tax=Isoptericola sp. NPDC057559 TaxID=3346168 RepID=UPI00368B93BE